VYFGINAYCKLPHIRPYALQQSRWSICGWQKAGRTTVFDLKPPDKTRRLLCQRIDPIEIHDKVQKLRRINWSQQRGNVELGDMIFTHSFLPENTKRCVEGHILLSIFSELLSAIIFRSITLFAKLNLRTKGCIQF